MVLRILVISVLILMRNMDNKQHKICSVCKVKKNIDDFYRRAAMKDGRKSGCKACEKISQDKYVKNNREKVKQTKRKWNDANIEHVRQYGEDYYKEHHGERLAYAKQYNEDNPEYHTEYRAKNKEKISKRDKEYREKNKDKIADYNQQHKQRRSEYDKKRYQENKELIKEQTKTWKSKNKDKVSAQQARRRARKAGVEENFTEQERKATLEKFGHKCFVCKSNNIAVDHHMPLSKGYALTADNATVLCKSCNSKKGTKLPEEFYTKEQLYELDKILKG